ncbi:MAG TPA: DsbA family protein [Baekduia sp.]|nr:DsbA family protein [Baekduia sp.]
MPPLRVEVWSDIDCPWCATGHARLREAIAGEPAGSVEVVHRAFELHPDGQPGTRAAHQLLKVAEHLGRGPEALEALFEAAHEERRPVGDPDVAAVVVARAAGLDAFVLRTALDEDIGLPEVLADEEQAARLGVRAVPFFLAGGRIAVRGAQEAPVLRRLLATARERAGAGAGA